VKHPRNDDYLIKNFNLIKSLIPKVPVGIVVQRTDSTWKDEKCDCSKKKHLYSEHLPRNIEGVLCVDLPGKDVLESERFLKENTEYRFTRLREDIKNSWNFIQENSNEKYSITKSGYFEGLKYFINVIWETLTGTVIFTTEIMKKVIQAFKDNGIDEKEAKRIITGKDK